MSSELVHSVVVNAAHLADITRVDRLLHDAENVVCAEVAYIDVERREEHGDPTSSGRLHSVQ